MPAPADSEGRAQLRVLAVTQGQWGERIAENIRQYAPDTWQVHIWGAPRVIPPVVDDPATYGLITPRMQTWSDLTKSGVSLAAGQQVLRIAMLGGDFNLNWIEIDYRRTLAAELAEACDKLTRAGIRPEPGGDIDLIPHDPVGTARWPAIGAGPHLALAEADLDRAGCCGHRSTPALKRGCAHCQSAQDQAPAD